MGVQWWERRVTRSLIIDGRQLCFFLFSALVSDGRQVVSPQILLQTHTTAMTLQFHGRLSRGQRPALKLMLVGHATAKQSRKKKNTGKQEVSFRPGQSEAPTGDEDE